jgi:hypothetical protein
MAELRSRLPGWAPTAAVLLLAAAGLVRVTTANWRQGAVLIGGALLLAAVLRALLDPDQVGLLAIRSRVLDTACYAVLGITMMLLAVTITSAQLTLG